MAKHTNLSTNTLLLPLQRPGLSGQGVAGGGTRREGVKTYLQIQEYLDPLSEKVEIWVERQILDCIPMLALRKA